MFEYVESKVAAIAKYAAENPSDFIIMVLIITAPFFALSAYLSAKLAKGIEEQKKKLKKIDKIKVNKDKKKK